MIGDFRVIRRCSVTKARISEFGLSSVCLSLPIFMPVGTYGAIKGICVPEIQERMILANTYHLRHLGRNIKEFMRFRHGMLTDSGGFQIGSLPNVVVKEEGVEFDEKMFRPEDSMDIQMMLGADVMMQLDEVVNPCDTREKIEAAMYRSIRWLDRCIKAVNGTVVEESQKRMKNNECDIPQIRLDENSTQVLFPIIQGGLDEDLRIKSIHEILKRLPKGIAIGGLSGGEEKTEFARIVQYCVENLPEQMPRYVMGVGYPEDLVVCIALGADMFDCVYPARTARFGRAFCDTGDIYFTSKFGMDTGKIDEDCKCYTCSRHSRAFLYSIKGTTNFCMLLTTHNLYYMRTLTQRIRDSIAEDRYPEFIRTFMNRRFAEIPTWIKVSLGRVRVEL